MSTKMEALKYASMTPVRYYTTSFKLRSCTGVASKTPKCVPVGGMSDPNRPSVSWAEWYVVDQSTRSEA